MVADNRGGQVRADAARGGGSHATAWWLAGEEQVMPTRLK